MHKQLIVTCDDAGLSRGINAAIAELASAGLVTTASVLPNVAYLHDLRQQLAQTPLSLGAHLNLSDGYALSRHAPQTGLSDQHGRFRGRWGFFARAVFATPAFLEAAFIECHQQMEWLQQAGMAPQHVSSHLHFQLLPALQAIAERLADEYALTWLRAHRLKRAIVPFSPLPSRRTASNPPREPPYSLDYVVDLRSWMLVRPAKTLVEVLSARQGTVELVVHPCTEHDPSYPDWPNPPQDRYRQMRYFQEFMHIFRNTDTGFQLVDPAATNPKA